MRLHNSSGLWAAVVVTFVCGIVLIIISMWLHPVAQAERASAQQDYEQALAYYDKAEQRFDQIGIAKRLFPASYDAVITNQYRILYRLDLLDQILERAAADTGNSSARYWSGAALFAKAIAQTEKEAQIAWLGRAREEFRSALEQVPNDWDTKYNYELTERLLAELRDKPAPPEQILELLRPKPKEGEPPSQPLG